jgi:Na+/H+-dicarboxylate symporter
MALDGMGTACNLTGDAAIASIVDKYFSKKTDTENNKDKKD